MSNDDIAALAKLAGKAAAQRIKASEHAQEQERQKRADDGYWKPIQEALSTYAENFFEGIDATSSSLTLEVLHEKEQLQGTLTLCGKKFRVFVINFESANGLIYHYPEISHIDKQYVQDKYQKRGIAVIIEITQSTKETDAQPRISGSSILLVSKRHKDPTNIIKSLRARILPIDYARLISKSKLFDLGRVFEAIYINNRGDVGHSPATQSTPSP